MENVKILENPQKKEKRKTKNVKKWTSFDLKPSATISWNKGIQDTGEFRDLQNVKDGFDENEGKEAIYGLDFWNELTISTPAESTTWTWEMVENIRRRQRDTRHEARGNNKKDPMLIGLWNRLETIFERRGTTMGPKMKWTSKWWPRMELDDDKDVNLLNASIFNINIKVTWTIRNVLNVGQWSKMPEKTVPMEMVGVKVVDRQEKHKDNLFRNNNNISTSLFAVFISTNYLVEIVMVRKKKNGGKCG